MKADGVADCALHCLDTAGGRYAAGQVRHIGEKLPSAFSITIT